MTALQLLQIELWAVERLFPYARNARTHSAEQVAQIAGSILAFGFNNPVLVDAKKEASSLATDACSRRGVSKSRKYRLSYWHISMKTRNVPSCWPTTSCP